MMSLAGKPPFYVSRALAAPVKPGRIVDEQFRAQRLIGGEVRNQVDEVAVVGHLANVRVRPIGAPKNTIRRGRDELCREWDGIRIIAAGRGYTLRPAHFD